MGEVIRPAVWSDKAKCAQIERNRLRSAERWPAIYNAMLARRARPTLDEILGGGPDGGRAA